MSLLTHSGEVEDMLVVLRVVAAVSRLRLGHGARAPDAPLPPMPPAIVRTHSS